MPAFFRLYDNAVGVSVALAPGRIARPLLHEDEVVTFGLVMALLVVERLRIARRRLRCCILGFASTALFIRIR